MATIYNPISAKNLIYFTLFFSPAYLIRFSIFNIPLNLLDILILLTIGVWIYENSSHLLEKIKISLRKIIFILPPVALILLGLFISALLNNNLFRELGIIKSWFILPIIFGFITFVEIKKNPEFDKILNTIFFSSFFISIVSLLYLALGQITYDGRLNAFYLSPNHLAMIIAPGFLIGCWKLVTKKNINYYLIIYLVLMALSLFYTHSYATWISIFFSIFVILISARKKYLLILIIAILFFFSLEYNSDKFKNIFNYSASSSLKSRLVIWQVSEKIIFDNWLWGIGAGNFQEKYLSYQKYFTPYPQWAVPQPHNIFLAFWLQTGLIGLIGFLYLIIAWGLETIKILVLSKDSTEKNLSLILLAIIFSMLIAGLFDTPYWKNDLSLIFWTIISTGAKSRYFLLKKNSK